MGSEELTDPLERIPDEDGQWTDYSMTGRRVFWPGSMGDAVLSFLSELAKCAQIRLTRDRRPVRIVGSHRHWDERKAMNMNLLSNLFGTSNSRREELVTEYARVFEALGLSQYESLDTAREMVSAAEREVAQRGCSNQPENYGDWLLQHELTDPQIHTSLQELRAEGVRDDDIRWWWNMSALERVLMERADEFSRMSAFLASLEQGMDGDSAVRCVFAVQAKFGNPAHGDGEDRPIPIELKRRIIDFTERHYNLPNDMRRKVQAATSFNALIRAEIRAGNL